jgi:8-amino-7-oxononanoate synthase
MHTIVATETVFSMDGDRAPLDELSALAARFDAWLMTDDAHGLGVVVPSDADVPLQMGTLSKAVGSYGGYLCASRPVIELIRNRARSFVYSTGLPPSVVAASIAALDLIARQPAYAALPLTKARAFTRLMQLPAAQSPIVPIVIGDARAALDASALLEREGFLVTAIRPPTVPDGTARLRLAFSAGHPDSEIDRLAASIAKHVVR